MKLTGKTAVITGASSGIGKAVALALASEGCNLVIAARRSAALDLVAADCRAKGVECVPVVTDVRDREACFALIERASETVGPPDILVNNAGFAIFDHIADAKRDDFESMMETNYFGSMHCIQAILPGMLKRGNGSIVNVSSIGGLMGYESMGAYCATKFAIVGMSEALRNEVIGHGITVSLVCPGTTRTEFFELAHQDKTPAASRLILAIPPERVARVVLRAIRTGRARIVVPWTASIYMRFKELMPGPAHWLMRNVSKWIGATKS